MHPTAQTLLDAHTRHVLQQLTRPELLDVEAAAFYDWLAARPVNAVADEVRVRDFLLRNVFSVEPSERLLEQIGVLSYRALQNPLNANARLEDLLNSTEYDRIVDRLISLEELRRDVVHSVMQNPAVTQLLSDLVYNGVKNYLAESNDLAKKVPGASSLMKLGKGLMEKVGADDALDGALKGYVKRNTRATMEMCERLVEEALETPKLKSISRQFWQQIKGLPLARLTQHVDEDNVQAAVVIGNTVWNHFRQSSYARELLNDLVHGWFEKWGELPASSVLETIGLDKARLQEEVRQVGTPLVAALLQSGHLEARVRVHLAEFYGSAEVEKLLG